MYPVLDEAALVHALPSLHAQPVFKCGQWTFNTQPAFSNHDGNGQQVQGTKPPSVHPPPAQQVARHNQQQAAHHKQHNGEVEKQHNISKVRVVH